MYSKFFKNVIIAAGIALVFIFAIGSCVKTTTTVPVVNSSSTIAAIINNATNLTVMDSILKITGQIGLLNGKDTQYTVFAPPNIAFSSIGIYDSTMYKYTPDYLTRLMRYHILAGYAKTASIISTNLAGPNAPYASASPGDTLYFTVNGNGIFVNGRQITQTDVLASNGVIQAVSGVLIPPNGTIWHTLAYDSSMYNDSSLTYLTAALNRANMSVNTPNFFDSLLSGSAVYSIFAPTNAAFRADTNYNFSSIAAISTIDPDSLSKLLSRHIVPGRVFSSDFSETNHLATLLPGDSIVFALTFGTTIMQKDSSGFVPVSVPNILSTNGVIHKIATVLVP